MRGFFVLGAFAAVTSLFGCGAAPADRPDLGKVSGTVTLDGQPLPNAQVVFRPVAGGQDSTATTDGSGNYQLQFRTDIPGAAVGEHIVRVTTFIEAVKGDDGKVVEPGQPERVPKKYNEASELRKEVKAGQNTIDLQLTSQ